MMSVKTVFSTIILQMKLSIYRATFKFVVLFQPILYGLIIYMIFKNSDKENFLSFVMLGTGLLSLWSSIIFSSAGDIERERYMGTLELISSSPTSFLLIIVGKVIGNTIWGIFSMILTILFVNIGFHVQFVIKHPLFFLISFIPSILSFMGIALVLATCFTLSRNARGFMNALEFPIFILCGLIFPLDLLPKWIRPISYILSPTWVAKILRISIVGIENLYIYWKYLAILLLITIFYFLLGYYLFKRVDKKTRINATLGIY